MDGGGRGQDRDKWKTKGEGFVQHWNVKQVKKTQNKKNTMKILAGYLDVDLSRVHIVDDN